MPPALLPIALLPLSARAAEPTELAPFLRGDLEIRYDLDASSSRLVEGEEEVGRRSLADHQLVYAGTFSFIKGAATYFEIPHTVSQTVHYGEARQMIVDADFGQAKEAGTMVDADEISDPADVKGAGLGGTWLGLRGAPMSEELFARRGDRVSWLIDVGYRFKDKSNFWSYNENGKRGGGDGAPAFRLRGAFSTTYRASQPYVTTTVLRTGRIETDVLDESGEIVASGLTIRPASEFDVGAGSEVLAGTYGEGEQRGQVKIDFNLHFGYRSWQDVPSGIYLPSILDITRSIAITEGEYAYVRGGLGLDWRMVEYAQLNVGGDIGTSTPHRIENPYPVGTAMGNIDWGVFTTLRFRARDPLFDPR